jgi:hypothetical protein
MQVTGFLAKVSSLSNVPSQKWQTIFSHNNHFYQVLTIIHLVTMVNSNLLTYATLLSNNKQDFDEEY